ncbi:hypothetical protein, partial [Leuconostoc mesenteroides]|uniref:hypothetical protein n=1 Tax=Leuconostoc mesenteroides TaxID=1245 RepID=UPI001EE49884
RNFITHSLTLSGHLTSQKIVRNVRLPLVNQFLAQGYALVRILSALKIKPSTYAQKSINWTIFLPEVKCFNAFSFFL